MIFGRMRFVRGSDDRFIFLLLLAVAAALYWPIVTIRPIHGDNFYVLSWAHAMPLSAVATIDPAIYPEWRPIPYLAIWLEHRLFGLAGAGLYFVVNLLIWTICATLVYRITRTLTGSRIAAATAGLLLIVDVRLDEPLTWIIGRQELLACLFGLGALHVLLVRRDAGMLRRREWWSVGALLVASALSKEYGLAFAVAIAAHGLWIRCRPQIAASTAAFAIYTLLRLGLAAGAVGGLHCDRMGLLFATEQRCVEPAALTGITQMAYNAVASAAGTVLPGLFSDEGAIEIVRARVARDAVVLVLVAIALRRGLQLAMPLPLLPLALLPLATGLMSFMVYRPRNHLPGLVGVVILAGIGLAAIRRPRVAARWPRLSEGAAVIAISVVLVTRAHETRLKVHATVTGANAQTPCDASWLARGYDRAFASLVKRTYKIPDPYCRDSE